MNSVPLVLIANDLAPLRTCLSRLMRIAGLKTIEASDGMEAMELFWKHPVDCVVTDQNMPLMDGLTVIRTIRSHGSCCPIILMSGEDSEVLRSSALESGADHAFFSGEGDALDDVVHCARRLARISYTVRVATPMAEIAF